MEPRIRLHRFRRNSLTATSHCIWNSTCKTRDNRSLIRSGETRHAWLEMKLKKQQYGLRRLFLVTTWTSIAIVIIQLCLSWVPQIVMVTFLLAMLGWMGGMFLIVLAAVLAFSIWMSPMDKNYSCNLGRCLRLATCGLICCFPFVVGMLLLAFAPSYYCW